MCESLWKERKSIIITMKPYYQDDYCTIYHQDCEQVLPTLDLVDLVLTDPPYGIGEAAGKNKTRRNKAEPRDYGHLSWDDKPIQDNLMLLVLGAGKDVILFGGNYYTHLLKPGPCWLVWDKENTGDFADCELAWSSLLSAVRLRRHRWNGMLRKGNESREHPTQKPLDLMKWCISIADKQSYRRTILDPFMGSGTTLRAAKDMGRKAIGIEMEERYCEMAAKRLRQEVLLCV